MKTKAPRVFKYVVHVFSGEELTDRQLEELAEGIEALSATKVQAACVGTTTVNAEKYELEHLLPKS